MKKQLISIIICSLLLIGITKAQDIPMSGVPSVILNEFQAKFPKASDIEWEKSDKLYKVEFELAWNVDHEVWYDSEGNISRHKEDITKEYLPKKVLNKLETDFKGFVVDDIERETNGKQIIFYMELNSLTQDWEIIIDESGVILSKRDD